MTPRTCWEFRQEKRLANPLRVFYRDNDGLVTYSSKAWESNDLLLSQCIIVMPVVFNTPKAALFNDWFLVEHPLKNMDKVHSERLFKETRDPYVGGIAMLNLAPPRHQWLPSLRRSVYFELEADAVMFSMWAKDVVSGR